MRAIPGDVVAVGSQMTSMVTQNIQFGNAGYLLLICVLGTLALYALWRVRRTPYGETMASLFWALVMVGLARAGFWGLQMRSVGESLLGLVVFSAVSLAAFCGFALMSMKAARLEIDDPQVPEDDATKTAPSYAVFREMWYVGFVCALVAVAKPAAVSSAGFPLVVLNLILIGAAVRVIAFAVRQIGKGPTQTRPGLFGIMAVVTLSWILYEITPVVSEKSAFWTLNAAKWADVLTLVSITGFILSGHVSWGTLRDASARRNREDMEAARSELSKLNRIAKDLYEDSNDLMTKQKEQALASARKAESLEKILQIGLAIQQRKNLEDVLQMIVELLRDNVGFKTVVLRLLNESTQSFETRAHVGLSPEVQDQIANYRIPMSEFEKIVTPRARISRSYFVRKAASSQDDDSDSADSMLVDNSWGEIEMLIVPLVTEEDKIIGYLSVEDPLDPDRPLGDVIEILENISTLAVIGIRNAKIFEDFSDKDQKLRDLTEKLSGLNKMKSNFVATISHEFRTPLTSIKAYCDTLIKNVDSVDKDLLREFLVVINEESGRLMALVEDILDFSQIESGAMNLERRPCNLKEIILSAASELSKNFELKNITLHQSFPQEDVVIQGERDLIRQLIVNLLHNASKFSKPGGKVWMRIEEEVGAARIIVEDSGIGIPEGQLEKIFEQFYQVDNTSTREHGGSGLGLALCRSVVEWHDGKIWVQNTVDGGARFVAMIPKKQVVVKSHVLNASNAVRRFEVEKFLELIVENVAELMGAGKVSLMLLDPENQELRIEGAIGIHREVVEHARIKIGEGISGRVAKEGRALLVTNIEDDKRVARKNNTPVYGSKSFLSVPIVCDGEVAGVINVSSPIGREAYNDKDRKLLGLFADRLAIAIGKLEKFTSVANTYERTRETLKAILDSKRHVEARDNDLVIDVALKAAEKLGLDDDTMMALPYVLNVYDLGLSNVGDHIVTKPRELSPEDRAEIETHTIVGDELLKAIEPASDVRNAILYHHENFDGTGYPGKLAGEAIPLEARIIRVADSLRALISERPYQRKYTYDEAKEILKHRAGTFFDPRIVDAFVEAMKECLPEAAALSNDRVVQPTTPQHSAPNPA